jgi:hypothetical protein
MGIHRNVVHPASGSLVLLGTVATVSVLKIRPATRHSFRSTPIPANHATSLHE